MNNNNRAYNLVLQAEGALKQARLFASPVSRLAVARALKDAERAKSAVAHDQPLRRASSGRETPIRAAG